MNERLRNLYFRVAFYMITQQVVYALRWQP